MKKIIVVIVCIIVLSGCATQESESILDPDRPITIRVWHYYNGTTQEMFNTLVSEFNETVGLEKGIVVEAQSQGSVEQLANSVFDAANKTAGSDYLPEIFASYADNAFRIRNLVNLVSLDELFSGEELAVYRKEFLEEGEFIIDNKYYIVPIAKSSENLYVNKTDWDIFAKKHNLTAENLKTWEGLSNVSELYYEETGKAFFSLNAVANFFIVGNKQLGDDLYSYNLDGSATINLSKENANVFWDYFITPYIKGHYTKVGRFSSDDAKTGSVLSYVGSTAGSHYFPTKVSTDSSNTYPIEPLVLPYPYFESGNLFAIQQGAGMCIVDTDEAHNLAAKMFLKWFTNPKQNLKFSVSTGYFPVSNTAIEEESILKELNETDDLLPSTTASVKTTIKMFNDYELYNAKGFTNSYEARTFLDKYIYTYLNQIRKPLLEAKKKDEEKYKKLLEEATSDEAFNRWYSDLIGHLNEIVE